MNEIMVPLLNVTCIVYRVETLWEASEMIGAMVLDGEGMISGLIMAPVVKSKLGKALLSTAPGEILLASLDSFGKLHIIAPLIATLSSSSLLSKFLKNIIK